MPQSMDVGLREQLRQLDSLYKETDHLYACFARSCDLSDCAYWIMYEIEVSGGSAPLRRVSEQYCYSKQTVSSALKSLEERGLVEVGFEEGSRKNKLVSFTASGATYSAARVVPAIEAETRAFAALSPDDRAQLVGLVAKYVSAVRAELDSLGREGN